MNSSLHATRVFRAKIATVLAASTIATGTLDAQTSATIPIRQLKNTISSDSVTLMSAAAVRSLPTGGVIVNDATKRQLVVYDSTLRHFKIIADTSTKSENSYGLRTSEGGLIPYVGDSTIFVDNESSAMLVINPRGEFARVMAPVRSSDLYFMSAPRASYGGASGFDPKGRLVYRAQRRLPNDVSFNTRPDPGKQIIMLQPDSAPIMRMDFDKRTVDTIGMIKVPVQKQVATGVQNGLMVSSAFNPLPSGDDWTLMADGTVAIVRVQDYHIDWLAPDGKITSTPKMPFDWKRLPIEDKQRLVDSVRKEIADREAKLPPPPPTPPGQTVFPRMRMVVVEPTDLPDFYPPVRQGQTRSDPAGNVWTLPSTSSGAKKGLLYDVINRKGEVIERVQLPEGRTLVGFGSDGTIYMHYVISPGKAALERAQIDRPPTP